MTWLVTGGAGYIGAHVLRELVAAGRSAVVLDDLSTGRRRSVPPGVPLIEASVSDRFAVPKAMRDHGIHGVIHLAGQKSLAESVRDPQRYYRENSGGTRLLIDAMLHAGVGNIVFSSSAAVYGSPSQGLVSETTVPDPVSPYGRSKLAAEWLIADAAEAFGLNCVALRYFNVAGTSEPELRDRAGTGLLPSVLDAVADGRRPVVFGQDYPTPDGSCRRDYVHVSDIAAAHLSAVDAIEAGPTLRRVYNVGRGIGCSVLEMIAAVREVTGLPLDYSIGPRRPGDVAEVVAQTDRITRELGWRAELDLEDMVRSEWNARQPSAAAENALS